MVCAICGRMPLIRHSAPISRAAATVFSRCCATSVSTTGTPVMSIIAIIRARLDDRFQQVLHHHLRAGAVQGSNQRQRQNILPQPHHRSGKFQQLLLLARDHVLRASSGTPPSSESPSFVDQHCGEPDLIAQAFGSVPNSLRSAEKSGRLRENTNEAVSLGCSHPSPGVTTSRQEIPERGPVRAGDIRGPVSPQRALERAHELGGLPIGMVALSGSQFSAGGLLLLDPSVGNLLLAFVKNLGKSTIGCWHDPPRAGRRGVSEAVLASNCMILLTPSCSEQV